METRMFIGVIALIAGFAAAYCLVLACGARICLRKAAIAASGGDSVIFGLVSWRVRNGYPFAASLVERLLKIGRVSHVLREGVRICRRKGVVTTEVALGTVVVVGLAGVAAVSFVIAGSAIGSIMAVVCVIALMATYCGHAEDKRRESCRDQVPAALESMSACLCSGFTLLQTFQQVSADVDGELGETFARSAHILETGGSADDALRELRAGAHASELAFVAVALDVQHQSGGAMRQVLDAARESVKGELALRRSLRVQTAQARLSARIVAIMPLLLVGAFSFATPDFLLPFFSSAFGYALLALAVVMQVSGILLVRKALAVEGVS